MSDNYKHLRWVRLEGPLLHGASGKRGDPMWSLVAAAPRSGDADSQEAAGYVHPLRSIAVDGLIPSVDADAPVVAVEKKNNRFKSGASSPHSIRPPRLIDAHLIVGATDGPFKANGESESLTLSLSQGVDVASKNSESRKFWTEQLDDETGVFPTPSDADFARVIAEPRPEPLGDQLGDFIDQAGDLPDLPGEKFGPGDWIRVPTLRLVQGSVRLGITPGKISWLKTLAPEAKEIVLTPDGVEFVARLSLPGSDTPLWGGFLLAPHRKATTDLKPPTGHKASALSLTLLPLHRETAANNLAWLDAWRSAAGFANVAREPLGAEFRTRAAAIAPAFRWQLFVKNGQLALHPDGRVIDVPAEEMRVELRGSIAVDGTPDGAAALRLTRLRLADLAGGKAVAKRLAETQATPDAALSDRDGNLADSDLFVIAEAAPSVEDVSNGTFTWATAAMAYPEAPTVRQAGRLVIRREGGLALAHDERRLAHQLREAVGWATPRPRPGQEDGSTEAGQPLLSGFIPIADGWLQIPVPNLPPVDLGSDADTLAIADAVRPSSLDGFVRFGDRPAAGLSSGYLTRWEAPIGETPTWSVTVEAADCAVAIARVQRGGSETPRVVSCRAVLREPDLAFRGLLWLSNDRPDAIEALPRLGAGAGSFIDVEFRNRPAPNEALRVVTARIDGFGASFFGESDSSGPSASRDAVEVALDFNPRAEVWKKGPAGTEKGKEAISAAVAALTGAVPTAALAPWPSVAWVARRGPPLAAAVPMTRAAESAVPPLESRSLAPFVAKVETGAETIPIAAIIWMADEAFPKRDDSLAFPKLAHAWPLGAAVGAATPAPGGKIPITFGGVPFVAFGVPGVEVSPLSPGTEPWDGLHFALRYDIPALDEAFATAGLPPTEGQPSQGDEREPAPARPVATALDWPLMAALWTEQDRRRQIAMVVDSYVALQAPPVDGAPVELDSRSLIRAGIWRPKLAFALAPEAGPYGALTIEAPSATLAGDDALLGLSLEGEASIDLELAGASLNINRMIGWSPASFERGGFETDNQGFGLGASKQNDLFFFRKVRNDSPDGQWGDGFLISAKQAIATDVETQPGGRRLAFWFRDVPLNGSGVFERDDLTTPFHAWLDPTGGFEWRLFEQALGDLADRPTSFRNGRDRIPLFGFMLEPLRLRRLEVAIVDEIPGATTVVEVLARLTLGDDETRPPTGDDLVVLRFQAAGHELDLKSVTSASGEALRFAFEAKDKAGGSRAIVLEALPQWDGSRLVMNDAHLRLPAYGWQLAFDDVDVEQDAQVVTITARGGATPSIDAYVKVDQVVVTVEIEQGRYGRADVKITSHAVIRPEGSTHAPISAVSSADGKSSFRFLDVRVTQSIEWREDHHALVVTGGGDGEVAETSLLSFLSLGESRRIGFMLAARVEPIEPPFDGATHVLRLACGRCEGEIRAKPTDGAPFAAEVVRWEVSKPRSDKSGSAKETPWAGHAEITGAFSAESAIAWPKLTTTPVAPGAMIGVVAKADPRGAYRHQTRCRFLRHRLDFALCAPAETGWRLAKPWRVCVVTAGSLLDGENTVLAWNGIEALAIGPADQIVPPPPDPGVKAEPVTFAARYRAPATGSSVQPAIIQSGLGDLRTVLQGFLGAAFRQGFWNSGPNGWGGANRAWTLVAGGFLGLDAAGKDEQALVRLPFLAAFGVDAPGPGALSQSVVPEGGVRLAWADTAAARKLLVRARGVQAPASAAEGDLHVALRAGALPDRDGHPPAGDIVPALLVEQFFASPFEAAGDWRNQPHWLASAAMLSAFLAARAAENPAPAEFRPLSLVAGATTVQGSKRPLRRGVAAALRGVDASGAVTLPTVTPALISGGTELVDESWTITGDSTKWNAQIAGHALARHAHPVFAVARLRKGDGPRYRAAVLPPPPAAEMPGRQRGPRAQAAFADIGRGFAAAPGENAPRWLMPVAEGRIAPVRDHDETAPSSGLAGLGRRLGLPAQAGQRRALCDEASKIALAQDLIWLTEKRAPVYEPLSIQQMQAPPIPWLRQSPTRTRLPADQDVWTALCAAGLGDAARSTAQAFLPAQADALAVSERAGVITARRAMLLGTATAETAFDRDHSRFGRPAQAGSSARRWMRTPRPGPLPPNTDSNPESDRRPQASPLLPQSPLRFVVGPADTIRGKTRRWLETWTNETPEAWWSATFVAAPFSDGVLGERWDGSVRLRVEIDIALPSSETGATSAAEVLANPLKLLGRLLFPFSATENARLRTGGSLKVDGISVPLLQMIADAETGWTSLTRSGTVPAARQDASEAPIRRSHVDLILDARAPGARSGIHPALSAAIVSGGKEVELRLVVHPGHTDTTIIERDRAYLVTQDTGAALAEGEARPPVALRWRMPAISSRRGGLPLAPSTLLFVDPAYEAGLAHPPVADSRLIDVAGVPPMALPANRGALKAVFSADRPRVNRRGTIAFMADVRFERPPAPRARPNPGGDGDFVDPNNVGSLSLTLQVFPRDRAAPARPLLVPPSVAPATPPAIRFAKTYELSLGALAETDGAPARLFAGDVLELTVTGPTGGITATFWNSENADTQDQQPDVPISKSDAPLSLSLRFTLTDEPVVEPPPALYAALVRSAAGEGPAAFELPLYAQSPLPWRVDFHDLRADFRAGLVRRSASFVWGLSRTLKDYRSPEAAISAHIVKIDRNGQLHLPKQNEFIAVGRMAQASA